MLGRSEIPVLIPFCDGAEQVPLFRRDPRLEIVEQFAGVECVAWIGESLGVFEGQVGSAQPRPVALLAACALNDAFDFVGGRRFEKAIKSRLKSPGQIIDLISAG